MIEKEPKLKPLLKYPGGKTAELAMVFKNAPKCITNYIEPFVGGGAVYFAVNADRYFINDISNDLMRLYEYIKNKNATFFNELDIIIDNWNKLGSFLNDGDNFLVNHYNEYREKGDSGIFKDVDIFIDGTMNQILEGPLFNVLDENLFRRNLRECIKSKFATIRKNEIKKNKVLEPLDIKNNIEAGIKASYYTYLRSIYNNPKAYKKLTEPRRVAIYFYIREYSYSGMFRFNRNGEFNVPYGGISYNKKNLSAKKKYFRETELLQHLKKTELFSNDFFDFLNGLTINAEDFMFLDPPYDTTFSEYDLNEFGMEDQKRLANYLIKDCPCRFMLVIKKTPLIETLYKDKGLVIIEEAKKYLVNFMDRNEKEVVHLTIMNYKKGE
jgi:DNA adenine methylase